MPTLATPRPQQPFSMRLTAALRARLRVFARRLGMSETSAARVVLARGLASVEQEYGSGSPSASPAADSDL